MHRKRDAVAAVFPALEVFYLIVYFSCDAPVFVFVYNFVYTIVFSRGIIDNGCVPFVLFWTTVLMHLGISSHSPVVAVPELIH